MTKQDKQVIKETIEDLLNTKVKTFQLYNELLEKHYGFGNKDYLHKRSQYQIHSRLSFDKPLVKLNHLLDKKEQYQEVLDIEKEMMKLQSKKYITVKEFTDIYGYSSDWQKNRRGRIHDPLPSRQDGHNKKITYVVSDIETWFENNNIGR